MDFWSNFINYLKGVDLKLLPVVLILMLLDILTGTIGAFKDKDFKSTTFREGLFKKLLEVILIVVGYLLDYTLTFNYIGVSCMYLIIGMEAYSIVIENMGDYIPLPDWLKTIINDLKNGEVKNDKD